MNKILFSTVIGITLTLLAFTPSDSYATATGFLDCSAVECIVTDNPPNPVVKNPGDGILLVWDEVQNFELTEDLRVDRVADTSASFIVPDGTGYKILAGTIVSSHYVQWDPSGRSGTVAATMEFDSEIFAFITADQKMFDSDTQLGLPGIDYNNFLNRGLESGDRTTMIGNEVDIIWFASSPGDWTRLITAFSPGGVSNEAPVAVDDLFIVDEDNILNGNILDNDTDVDEDELTVSLGDSTSDGILVLNSDGTFTYTPNENFFGTDSFTYTANDGTEDSNTATVTITVNPVNDAPVCSVPTSSIDNIWPPNHKMKSVTVDIDATDVDGDILTISITGILQDEEVNATGDGDTSPDGEIIDDSTVNLRAERSGLGDGRIYVVTISANDGEASCNGDVIINVPHDKKDTSIDSEVRYNSLG